MSTLFDRLEKLFAQGHASDVPDLMSDARFADAERTADAAVLIAVTDRPQPGLILTQRPHCARRKRSLQCAAPTCA